jgi:hypothetical protein
MVRIMVYCVIIKGVPRMKVRTGIRAGESVSGDLHGEDVAKRPPGTAAPAAPDSVPRGAEGR